MEDRDGKKTGTGVGAVAGAAGGVAAGAAVGGMTGPVGAALGAAVGAGIGAVSGQGAAGAADSDGAGSHGGNSMQTVIGAFDDTPTAQRAVERLAQSGFDCDDVHLQHGQGDSLAGQQHDEARTQKKGGFFARLFGMDDADDGRTQQHQHAEHAYTYDEAVRRGSAVVVVDAHDDDQADRAATLLHELGAMDVDERSKQWRAEGWQPPHVGTQQGFSAGQQNDMRTKQEGVLNVVEEQLQVGKRTLDRGGVRVIQRVSSGLCGS